MSLSPNTPGVSPAAPSKPQRVLACMLCQQRKVKCDRKFPCLNCIKSRAQCVPATLAVRRRKRKLPERELLERLHKYEDLLRRNNIQFQPLDSDLIAKEEPANAEGSYASDDEYSEAVKSEKEYEAKNIWHAMSQDVDVSNDDVREVVVSKAWDQAFEDNDHLLFGSRETAVDLSTLHPEPVHIFRLWQIYLDNVNPLLKVIHTPSLQPRIIEAASNIMNIEPVLEALMFSIYCMSILSLLEDDCMSMFGSSKAQLSTRYQFGSQQALLNCGFLRRSDRDCLTALYLYLVSLGLSTVPSSLSSMFGVAIRIAQRMGIHNESTLAKCAALEAEMRRRLWWSLVLFDARIGELAGYNTATLAPTWDCKIALNVNDSDLRPEMKEAPDVQGRSTEALFAVVRSELGDFIRHSTFHLDFTNPALKPVAKDVQQGSVRQGCKLSTLEETMEARYLKFCDPENPLHFMAIWTTRGVLARCRLMEHLSRSSGSSTRQTETHRAAPITHSLDMLKCDTKIARSPLTKGFRWLADFHFPFIAYVHIVQDLRKQPVTQQAELSWEVMSDNFEARAFQIKDDNPLFQLLVRIVLQGWKAREVAFMQLGKPLIPPRIVLQIRQKLAHIASSAQKANAEQPNGGMSLSMDDFRRRFDNQNEINNAGVKEDYGTTWGPEVYFNMPGQAPFDVNVDEFDWSAMDWNLVMP